VVKHLLGKPPSESLEDRVAFSVKTWELIGSPDYPTDKEVIEIFVKGLLDRGMPRVGTARQMLAIAAAKGRVEALSKVSLPSLVIHGKEDPLLPAECGISVADALPNCTLELVDGMGHDFPVELIPSLSEKIVTHLNKV